MAVLVGAGIAGCVLVAWARASDPISAGTEGKPAALEGADNLELGEEEPGVLEVVLDATLVRPLNLGPKCRLSP